MPYNQLYFSQKYLALKMMTRVVIIECAAISGSYFCSDYNCLEHLVVWVVDIYYILTEFLSLKIHILRYKTV